MKNKKKRRRLLFLIIIFLLLFDIVYNKFFVYRPFSDLSVQNTEEVDIRLLTKPINYSFKTDENLENIVKALNKIKIKREIEEPIIESNVVLIQIYTSDGKMISVQEATPFLSIESTWYEVDAKSLKKLENIYAEYIFAK